MTIGVTIDLRERFGPPRNQGSRPTCLAFALSDAHAAARASTEPLSCEHLYFNAVQRMPARDPAQGVALPVALEALRDDGQCAEPGWPYLSVLPSDLLTWSPPPTASPVFRHDSTVEPCQLDALIGNVQAGRPMLLTLLLGERFYRPTNNIVDIGPEDRNTAHHALVAIGLGLTLTERAILVRNSWGPAWGDDGHCWISESYLRPRLRQIALLS